MIILIGRIHEKQKENTLQKKLHFFVNQDFKYAMVLKMACFE